MKKTIVALLLFIYSSSHAQTWKTVGVPAFSGALAVNPMLVIDNNNNLYTTYADQGVGLKATVMKYDGSAWNALGTPGFSPGQIGYPGIALNPLGIPYVVFADAANGFKCTVMKYDGSSWVYVGSPGFSDLENFSSIAIDRSGTPYVVYNGAVGKANVMKYNGTSWVSVGIAGFSSGMATFTTIAIGKNDTPFVLFKDVGFSNRASMMKYDGTSWVYVGGAGFSVGEVSFPSMVIDSSGIPWVAFEDYSISQKATVMKYTGGNWITVGSPGFSSGQAECTSITFNRAGIPYVAFSDGSKSLKAAVMTYIGGSWVNVGNTGFSIGQAEETVIVIDTNGIPYVGYADGGNGRQTYVMAPDILLITGADTVCNGAAITLTDAMTGGSWSSSKTSIATISSSGAVSALDTGTVTISYTVTGISTTHTVKVKRCTVGISPLEKTTVSIFPNPANDGININGISSVTNYRLLTITGLSMSHGTLQQGDNMVSMLGVAPGIYMLEMTTADGDRKVVRVAKE